jgi:hypothetical protein
MCIPLCEPPARFIRMKENVLNDFVKLALVARFGKEVLGCSGIRAYCTRTSNAGKFTLGDVRRIRNCELQHPPYYFSTFYDLTAISASVF